MVGGQGGSQRLHLHDPAQQVPPGKAFLPPKELHLIVCVSLTEISTGTETNGICFSLPPPCPSGPQGTWGRGEGRFGVERKALLSELSEEAHCGPGRL